MIREVVIGGALGVGLWWAMSRREAAAATVDNSGVDPWITGSDDNMASKDNNVQAFLTLIRTGEGTVDSAGYSRLVGGGQFQSFADHPRKLVTIRMGGKLIKSTAAGAYQILARTWDDLKSSGVSLPDFSPASQDKAALALIRRRGAMQDVIAGRFATAIRKCSLEWASLPGSPYGQPTMTMQGARDVLAANGAAIADGAAYA